MTTCPKRTSNFCDCDILPCARLKELDKRYRTKYNMSMIENLKFIKKYGIRRFLKQQEKKYVRKKGVYCVHDQEYHK